MEAGARDTAQPTQQPRTRLLVVDDDPGVRSALHEFLEANGFDVRSADSGRAMDAELARRPADLIVLDYMMPGEDGLAICRRMPKDGPPIIMLSARGVDDLERIVGLEAGADDYLGKPFHPRELVARIRSVLRRRAPGLASPAAGYAFGSWTLLPEARSLIDADGVSVLLTRGEFDLLLAFVENPQRVLSRDEIGAWLQKSEAEPQSRTIDLQISRLRRKLGDNEAEIIQTVRGAGYLFTLPVRRL